MAHYIQHTASPFEGIRCNDSVVAALFPLQRLGTSTVITAYA